MSKTEVVMRADASATIGAGHLIRCMALAQAARDRGLQVALLTAAVPAALRQWISAEGVTVVPAPEEAGSSADGAWTRQACEEMSAQWLVVDGYALGGPFHRGLGSGRTACLKIDDIGMNDCAGVDMVLNQNSYARADACPARSTTRLLLGPEYALLRRGVRRARAPKDRAPPPARILVTLGGAPHPGTLAQVIDALEDSDLRDRTVRLVGGFIPGGEAAGLDGLRKVAGRVETAAGTVTMEEHLGWADIVISGGGSTCWELACLGLPALALALVDNQVPVVRDLVDRHVLRGLTAVTVAGLHREIDGLIHDPADRARMSENGMRLVDGDGVDRVLSEMFADE